MNIANREIRKKDMLLMRDNNYTLQEIGDKYGLTRERVRQIIGNTGYILNEKYSLDERRCYGCKQTKKMWDFYTDKCNVCIDCTKKKSAEVMKTQHMQDYKKGGKYYQAQLCRIKTNYLIKKGSIKKTPCIIGMENDFSDCRGRIEAHHYAGYNHPELVEFYCSKHHSEVDGSKWGKS